MSEIATIRIMRARDCDGMSLCSRRFPASFDLEQFYLFRDIKCCNVSAPGAIFFMKLPNPLLAPCAVVAAAPGLFSRIGGPANGRCADSQPDAIYRTRRLAITILAPEFRETQSFEISTLCGCIKIEQNALYRICRR